MIASMTRVPVDDGGNDFVDTEGDVDEFEALHRVDMQIEALTQLKATSSRRWSRTCTLKVLIVDEFEAAWTT